MQNWYTRNPQKCEIFDWSEGICGKRRFVMERDGVTERDGIRDKIRDRIEKSDGME